MSVVVLPVQREQLRHTASSVSVHGENSHSVLSAAHAVHDEQTRPLLLVGGTDSNVFSSTHSSRGSQTRSFSGDGAMLSNSDVALQGSECGAHTRSLLAVGADVWYLPAKQADTSAQKRLLDAVGAAVSYWLAPHTRTPAHRRSLNAVRSVTMNWLSVHTVAGVHTRWVVGVGAFDCHSSALHTRSAVHALSDVAVGSVDAYSVAASQSVRGEHIRSDNAVGAVDCHSVGVHCRSGVHVLSDVTPAGALSNSSARHVVSALQFRSRVSSQGLVSYSNALQLVQPAHTVSDDGEQA